MAQKIIHTAICDYCPPEDEVAEGVETFTFPSGSGLMEAEGCPDHRKAVEDLVADLDEYAKVARRSGRGPAVSSRRAPRTAVSRAQNADVRAWAKEKGYQVSDRGRIPAAVTAEYEASH